MRRAALVTPALIFALSACVTDAEPDGVGDEDGQEESSTDDTDTDATAETEGDTDTTEDTDTAGGTDTDGETDTDAGTDTAGDTDGETGEEQPPPNPHAEAACSMWEAGTVEAVQSVLTQADANQVVLTPTESTAYRVTLNEDPEGGYVGWVNMSIPDWGSSQAVFAEADVEYELFRSEGMDQLSFEENLSCPDAGITDERLFFPHWADAQARFHSPDKTEIWFMFFKV